MANYSVNITDNGDGTFALTNVLRAPTTAASGGTNVATTGVDAISSTTLRSPAEALAKAAIMIQSYRSTNNVA